jgi:hypothetical protein
MRGTQDPVSQEYVSSNLTPCTFISETAEGRVGDVDSLLGMLELPFPEGSFVLEFRDVLKADFY